MLHHYLRNSLILIVLASLAVLSAFHVASANSTPAPSKAPHGPEDIQGQMYCNFGTNGVAIGSAGAADHWTSTTLVYPSTAGANAGKIVAVGAYNAHIMVMRFNTDGSLDTSFSGDGMAPVSVRDFEYGYNAALDSNGKIVVIGNGMTAGDGNLVAVRLNTDGSLDTTFSGDGRVNLDIDGLEGYSCGGDCQYFSGIAIQSDDKILIAGQSRFEDYSTIVRLTTAGALDTTFSGDGIYSFVLSGANHSSYIKDIALSSTGQIYVVGGEYVDPVSRSYVARLTSAGALDTSFDSDGWLWTTINGSNTYASDILMLSDGRIATLYNSRDGGSQRAQTSVTVMSNTGALDTSFGGDGIASVHLFRDPSDDSNGRLIQQADGKIVIASDTAGSSKGYMALARFNTTGSLDTNFGSGGVKRLSLPYASLMGSQSLALTNDGNLAVLGLIKTSDTYKKFALIKFLTGSASMSYGFSMAIQNTKGMPRGYERDAVDLLVCMNGAQNPLNATSFTFNTTGTTNTADLTSAAAYYTTADIFSNATRVGSVINSPNGTLNFNQSQTLASEFNHFWLAYTTSASATIGNVIDGQATSVTVDGIARTPDITSPTGSRTIFDLLPARINWTDDWNTGTVKRVDLDGNNPDVLLNTYAIYGYGQTGMALDMTNQFLYFVQSDNTLARSTLDGSALTELMLEADIFNPRTLAPGLAVDPVNSRLYYSTYATDAGGAITAATIYRANLDASSPIAILTSGVQLVSSMAVDTTNGKLYWYDYNNADGNALLRRANLDGSSPQTLDTLSGVYGGGLTLDVPNNKIYYVDAWGYNLKQASLDGSNKSNLITGLSDAGSAVTLDAVNHVLYWLGWDTGSMYRAAIASPGTITTVLDNYRAYGSNILYKPQQGLPGISTPNSADITTSSATLGGNVTTTGEINITERGVYWSTNDGFTPPGQGTKVSEGGNWGNTGLFTIPVTGLPSSTPIYFKAFVTNPAGTAFTSQATFTTLSSSCTGIGSGTVNWTVAFAACPPGAKYVIPVGLNVILDADIALDVDLEVLGTLDATSQQKTLTLTGNGNQTLTGNPLNFYNLTINKTNKTDTVTVSGKLKVTKKLTVTKGKLKSASDYGDVEIGVDGTLELTNDITVGGTWINNGDFIANTAQVAFDGTAPQAIGGTNPTRFYRLVISPTAGVFITTTPAITDTVINYGVLSQTQTVNNNTVNFLQFSATKYQGVDFTTADDLGAVTVAVSGEHAVCTADAGSPDYRNRCFRVNVERADMSTATMIFYTTAAEDDLTGDIAYQYYPAFPLWAEVGDAPCDTTDGEACTASSVTVEVGDNFFLIGGVDAPTAVTLRNLSAAADSAGRLDLSVLLLAAVLLLGLSAWWLTRRVVAYAPRAEGSTIDLRGKGNQEEI